jgi:hypothetical protein
MFGVPEVSALQVVFVLVIILIVNIFAVSVFSSFNSGTL